jgi:hypothetical protein
MAADPIPGHRITFEDANSSIVVANPRGIDGWIRITYALEAQTGVPRVGLELFVGLVRLPLGIGWQRGKKRAKFLRAPRLH